MFSDAQSHGAWHPRTRALCCLYYKWRHQGKAASPTGKSTEPMVKEIRSPKCMCVQICMHIYIHIHIWISHKPIKVHVDDTSFIYLSIVCLSLHVGAWTYSLVHARQLFYHWATTFYFDFETGLPQPDLKFTILLALCLLMVWNPKNSVRYCNSVRVLGTTRQASLPIEKNFCDSVAYHPPTCFHP